MSKHREQKRNMSDTKYKFDHFQDLMCGYYSSSAEGLKWADSLFKKCLDDFSYFGSRTDIQQHCSENFRVYTTSKTKDFAARKDDAACSVGYAAGLTCLEQRTISQYFLFQESIEECDIFNFVDSRFSTFVKKNGSCFLVNDYYGKKKLFYKLVNNVLFFSNEFRTLTNIESKKDHLNPQVLRDFLTLGIAIGDETIVSEIQSVPLQGYIEFNGHEIIKHKWKHKVSPIDEELKTEDVVNALTKSFLYFTKQLGFKFADLTGGADTRLNMAIASSLGTGLIYTAFFNPEDANNYLDEIVVRQLIPHHQLSFEYPIVGPYRGNGGIIGNPFHRHRMFDGDMRCHTLSGMFGGELLGGWSYNHFLGDDSQSLQKENENYLFEKNPSSQFEGTVDTYTNFKNTASQLEYADPNLLYTIYLSYGSALFYRVGTTYWLEPYLLSNRKLSIFLSDALLRLIGQYRCTQQLKDYNFYRKIYSNHFTHFLKISFNSEIGKNFGKATDHILNHVDPAVLLSKKKSSLSPHLHEVQRREKFLLDWLTSMGCERLLEKSCISSQVHSEVAPV
jgi:hypothetical protein